jgi:ureidoglycolate lyase
MADDTLPNTVTLKVEPLSAPAFAPFGDVIEATDAARRMTINDGFAERFHDLAKVDLGSAPAGHTLVNIFRAQPRTLPFSLRLLERHPLGSQAFMPLAAQPYLVVVAPGDEEPDLAQIRCFLAAPGQGVNYARGTWHHPLLTLHGVTDFLVVDRGGAGKNLDERPLPAGLYWVRSAG